MTAAVDVDFGAAVIGIDGDAVLVVVIVDRDRLAIFFDMNVLAHADMGAVISGVDVDMASLDVGAAIATGVDVHSRKIDVDVVPVIAIAVRNGGRFGGVWGQLGFQLSFQGGERGLGVGSLQAYDLKGDFRAGVVGVDAGPAVGGDALALQRTLAVRTVELGDDFHIAPDATAMSRRRRRAGGDRQDGDCGAGQQDGVLRHRPVSVS